MAGHDVSLDLATMHALEVYAKCSVLRPARKYVDTAQIT